MDLNRFLNSIFLLDTPSALKIIVWGNLMIGILVSVYRSAQKVEDHRIPLTWYATAKFIQCIAWILIMHLHRVPDLVSINFGTSLLFWGLFLEARVFLSISETPSRWIPFAQAAGFLSLLVLFNLSEFCHMHAINRIALSIFIIAIIFAFPGVACFSRKRRSPLRIVIGSLYLSFFVFSFLREITGLFSRSHALFAPFLTESIIFLVLILALFIGGAGFLLLVKEDSDRKILDLAYLDPLTGLLNRRHFTEDALVAFERHARAGEVMSVLFLDLDHFKLINDKYGHSFGDEILRDFSTLIRKSVRTTDLTCRWGGEEFVILLAKGTKAHAVAVGRRLQASISESYFPRHPAFSYTVSIGIHSAVPRDVAGDTLESFIEKSDKALYQAKESGRNCFVVSDESSS